VVFSLTTVSRLLVHDPDPLGPSCAEGTEGSNRCVAPPPHLAIQEDLWWGRAAVELLVIHSRSVRPWRPPGRRTRMRRALTDHGEWPSGLLNGPCARMA
jgi:hypothetical protein